MWKIFDFLYLDGELDFEDPAPILAYAELAAANDATRAWVLGEYYLFDGERYCEVESDAEKGLAWLTAAAQLNPSLFATKLGDLFAEGKYLKADMVQALHWWEAAAQVDGGAAYFLSQRYQKGQFVAKDTQRALHWMQHGAHLGQVSCMNQLASAYAMGEQIEKDETLAIFWWEKAAKLEISFAYKLAEIFLAGKLIKKNDQKAIEWFQVAAKAGHTVSIQKLERLGIKIEKP